MRNAPIILPVLDDPPRDGSYAPELSELTLTPEEIAAGNTAGAAIYAGEWEAR